MSKKAESSILVIAHSNVLPVKSRVNPQIQKIFDNPRSPKSTEIRFQEQKLGKSWRAHAKKWRKYNNQCMIAWDLNLLKWSRGWTNWAHAYASSRSPLKAGKASLTGVVRLQWSHWLPLIKKAWLLRKLPWPLPGFLHTGKMKAYAPSHFPWLDPVLVRTAGVQSSRRKWLASVISCFQFGEPTKFFGPCDKFCVSFFTLQKIFGFEIFIKNTDFSFLSHVVLFTNLYKLIFRSHYIYTEFFTKTSTVDVLQFLYVCEIFLRLNSKHKWMLSYAHVLIFALVTSLKSPCCLCLFIVLYHCNPTIMQLTCTVDTIW